MSLQLLRRHPGLNRQTLHSVCLYVDNPLHLRSKKGQLELVCVCIGVCVCVCVCLYSESWVKGSLRPGRR